MKFLIVAVFGGVLLASSPVGGECRTTVDEFGQTWRCCWDSWGECCGPVYQCPGPVPGCDCWC